MSAKRVMNPSPLTLTVTNTFAEAVSLMQQTSVYTIPVIDAQDRYMGMFNLADIWELLLPKAALIAGDSLTSLAFVSDGPQEMSTKLAQNAGRSVGEFLANRETPAVQPDTPLKEVILLIYRYGGGCPVVEKETGKLVGIVTASEILKSLL